MVKQLNCISSLYSLCSIVLVAILISVRKQRQWCGDGISDIRGSSRGSKARFDQIAGQNGIIIWEVRVATTDISEHFETTFRQLGRHLSISVFSPSPRQFASAFSDISERKTHQRILDHQATYDTLTGLPNRHCFEQHLDDTLECDAGTVGT